MKEERTNPEDEAEFNSALAFLKRLNELEYMIEQSLMTWNILDAYSILESYENELCFCFTKEDEEKVSDLKNEIIFLFNKYSGIGTPFKLYHGKMAVRHGDKIPLIRDKLIRLNKCLRKIKQKGGMGMPSKGAGKMF